MSNDVEIKDLLHLKMNLQNGPFKRRREPQITVLLSYTIRATYSKFQLAKDPITCFCLFTTCVYVHSEA